VKSIRFSGNQAHIVGDECILCGQCFVICPQNAKVIVDSTETVKVMIQSGSPVVASLAPSFIVNYGGAGVASMRAALKRLGFADAEETAVGATVVKREYERMLESRDDPVVSTCCHSVNLLVQKYFPGVVRYLADVYSPMQAHCADIKRRNSAAKTVFIGPCVAKKDEAERYPGIVDAVLTFEELSAWMESAGIKPEHEADSMRRSRARLFPAAGGIIRTMNKDTARFTYMAVDSVENCVDVLKELESGGLRHCFIEMSACAGSCIGGPVMEKRRQSPVRGFMSVREYAGPDDFDAESGGDIRKTFDIYLRQSVCPGESEINEILRRMGKHTPKDMLNCGTCGYDTCRDKAIAIYQGKADLSMCLPFLKDRAESFSDTIINNTPNGILVMNENMEVQQINRAALNLMRIPNASAVLGAPVVRILDPTPFMNTLRTGASIHDQKAYLAEYDKYVEQTVIYDNEYKVIVCLMRDVTPQEAMRAEREASNRKVVETADHVVEKQMRIVQEIASLLGETAAETKIALSKLKESIADE
jgi:ferredoxin